MSPKIEQQSHEGDYTQHYSNDSIPPAGADLFTYRKWRPTHCSQDLVTEALLAYATHVIVLCTRRAVYDLTILETWAKKQGEQTSAKDKACDVGHFPG